MKLQEQKREKKMRHLSYAYVYMDWKTDKIKSMRFLQKKGMEGWRNH